MIHTDFVTQANRQDIVTTSARNLGLLDGIADAFIKAVLEFCEHSTLQYQWMRYLPEEGDYPWDGFWKKLVSKIKTRLSDEKVLRPRSLGPLRFIRALRRHTNLELDRNWQPLFDDIQPELYLSKFYARTDLNRLQNYGLEYTGMDAIIVRVAADLKHPNSRMKSSSSSDDWHSRAAQLLCLPFEREWHNQIRELKELDLLPTPGSWKPAPKGTFSRPFYYPEANGVTIPEDLPVDLIEITATKNPDRRRLFDFLGVTEASAETIRGLIFQKYIRGEMADWASFSLNSYRFQTSRNHLQFLYLTHKEQTSDVSKYQHIAIYTQDEYFRKPHEVDVYVSNDHPYGARELLKQTDAGIGSKSGAPGFAVPFLRASYFQGVPNQPESHSLAWLDWLQSCLGIRRHLRLTANGLLTDICEYIAEHRPEKFLGTLQYHWQFEKQAILQSNEIKKRLQDTEVICEGNKMYRLFETYLPISELKECCARFMENGEHFPFLKLEVSLGQANRNMWMFLHDAFDVSLCEDIAMYLTVLDRITLDNDDFARFKRRDRIFDLYQVLHAKCLELEPGEREVEVDRIRYVKLLK